MNITPETMILFGGTILVLLLRLKRSHAKKRRRGSAMLVALLVEFLTLLVGVSIFLLGAYRLVP